MSDSHINILLQKQNILSNKLIEIKNTEMSWFKLYVMIYPALLIWSVTFFFSNCNEAPLCIENFKDYQKIIIDTEQCNVYNIGAILISILIFSIGCYFFYSIRQSFYRYAFQIIVVESVLLNKSSEKFTKSTDKEKINVLKYSENIYIKHKKNTDTSDSNNNIPKFKSIKIFKVYKIFTLIFEYIWFDSNNKIQLWKKLSNPFESFFKRIIVLSFFNISVLSFSFYRFYYLESLNNFILSTCSIILFVLLIVNYIFFKDKKSILENAKNILSCLENSNSDKKT